MKLSLTGHDYKYAVEQIMLMLFPEEKPVYGGSGSGGLSAEVALTYGGVYAQAHTIIRSDGECFRGISRVRRDKLTDKLVSDRLLQKIIKQSFYKAASAYGAPTPVWGSLTGIRPAKLAAAMLEGGQSEDSAAKAMLREYHVSPERALLCAGAARAGLDIKRAVAPRDAAIYIGVPFCPTRCAYCSFVSNSVEKSFGLVEPFVEALLAEIKTVSETARRLGLRIISVYFGGGTPTSLTAEQLDRVAAGLKTAFNLSEVREYTVEAGRPDTITAEKLEAALRGGATRVSVNPQSMSQAVLSAIGRGHTPEDITRAAALVRRYGGLGLNMDVIAGLPGDTAQGFYNTLDTVLDFAPENITVHTLSLKKGSRIMLEGAALPGGAEVSEMLDYASGRLRQRGYRPYYLYRQKFTTGGFENTGWSLPGYECMYNVCMMEELCTVIALGGGGVTKLVSQGGRIERIFNPKYPREYIERTGGPREKAKRIDDFYRAETPD